MEAARSARVEPVSVAALFACPGHAALANKPDVELVVDPGTVDATLDTDTGKSAGSCGIRGERAKFTDRGGCASAEPGRAARSPSCASS